MFAGVLVNAPLAIHTGAQDDEVSFGNSDVLARCMPPSASVSAGAMTGPPGATTAASSPMRVVSAGGFGNETLDFLTPPNTFTTSAISRSLEAVL